MIKDGLCINSAQSDQPLADRREKASETHSDECLWLALVGELVILLRGMERISATFPKVGGNRFGSVNWYPFLRSVFQFHPENSL